jgi:hypothetical protein
MFTPAIPELCDAAEAYRPAIDFGDAPASYSPNAYSAAAHEGDNNLRLGSSLDIEWDGINSAIADADGPDEDGIGAAPALNISGRTTYTLSNIAVYNHTGSNATLIGWLDYNFNGTFEAGEGVMINVPTGSGQQLVTLTWSNIIVPNPTALQTFLRLRITSASNGMTTGSMNGWFANGEVEDFPVVIGVVLPMTNPGSPAAGKTEAALTLFPNPAVNYTNVQVNATARGAAELQLIDNSGKIIAQMEKAVQPGVNQITLNDLKAWPAGIYTVRVILNKNVLVTQLVINR